MAPTGGQGPHGCAGPASAAQVAASNSTTNLWCGRRMPSWATDGRSSQPIHRHGNAPPQLTSRPDPSHPATILETPPIAMAPESVLPSPAPSDEPSPGLATWNPSPPSRNTTLSDSRSNVSTAASVPSQNSQTRTCLSAEGQQRLMKRPAVMMNVSDESGVSIKRSMPVVPSSLGLNTPPMSAVSQFGPSAQPSQPHNPPTKKQYLGNDGAAYLSKLKANHILTTRIQACGGDQSLDKTVVFPRYSLLREACEEGDLFFILLHQIFCLWTVNPPQARLTFPVHVESSIFELAMSILGLLLKSNTGVPTEHLKWFAMFPAPMPAADGNPIHTRTIEAVLAFLIQLGIGWQVKINHHARYGFPLLMSELLGDFKLFSKVLQDIAFRASRRHIGIPDGPGGNETDALFRMDQSGHRNPCGIFSLPPRSQATERYDTSLIQKYQGIYSRYRGHPAPSLQSQAAVPLPHEHSINTPAGQPLNLPTQPNTQQTIPRGRFNNSPLPAQPVELSYAPSHLVVPAHNQTHAPVGIPNFRPPHHLRGPGQQQQQLPSPIYASNASSPTATPTPSAFSLPTVHQQPNYNATWPNPSLVRNWNQQRPQLRPTPTDQMTLPPIVSDSHKQPKKGNPSAFFPPPGAQIHISEYPHDQYQRIVVENSLHQANLRSPPRMTPARRFGKLPERHYQAVRSFSLCPTAAPASNQLHTFDFAVSEAELRRLSKQSRVAAGCTPIEHVTDGSIEYRLRCCYLEESTAPISEELWVVCETTWPAQICMELNGYPLDVRRKHHNSKDLPVNMTSMVRLGTNRVQLYIPTDKPRRNNTVPFVAVEVVQTLSHSTAMASVRHGSYISACETRNLVKKRLRAPSDGDELSMVVGNLTVKLADPFSFSIYKTPVRGKTCTHLECFDLENWLNTRPTKKTPCICTQKERAQTGGKCQCQREPSLADKWKCPLCDADARPWSLVIDKFFEEVRSQLDRDGLLRTKEISVSPNGSWKAIDEPGDDDSDIGSDGDESMSRHRRPSAKASYSPAEVIELD